MYSVILCKKLSGSLKTMGIVIFDSSCEKETTTQVQIMHVTFPISGKILSAVLSLLVRFILHFHTDPATSTQWIDGDGENERWVLTNPMHFFRMLQILTLLRENMGAGNDSLQWIQRKTWKQNPCELTCFQTQWQCSETSCDLSDLSLV